MRFEFVTLVMQYLAPTSARSCICEGSVPMKILIFGGSGFLGTRLVPRLKEFADEVLAPRSREIDLYKEVPLSSKLKGVDVVIHAAAFYGGMPFDMENQAQIFAANTRMNLNVFEFCRKAGVGKLVTIGSACAYPGYVENELREEDFFCGPLHKTVECHGFTKLWMIEAHKAYKASYGLNGVHLVPANLYGPGDVYQLDRSHVVAALIKKYTDAHEAGSEVRLMGTGAPVREFLYIDDLCELIVRAVKNTTHEDLPINAGTGTGHTIRQLAEIIAEKTGFSGPTIWDTEKENGALHKVMNIERMQRVLGPFQPTPLADGITETLRWYVPRKREADQRQ